MRLLDWPVGLKWSSREPLSGPRSAGGAASGSLTGFVQTTASPFGLWRWQFSFPPMRGEKFRRWRGLVTALHGGANAVRVPFCDPDGLGWPAIGVTISQAQIKGGLPWTSSGLVTHELLAAPGQPILAAPGQPLTVKVLEGGLTVPWSNGLNWSPGRPIVALAAAAKRGASVIALADEYFGHVLKPGDMLGFTPWHFGLYMVTEARGAGVYRIWPPLRGALTTDSRATLEPVLAMRLESETAASAGRGPLQSEAPTMTLVEVEDATIREFIGEA